MAQLVARLHGMQKVRGSNPLSSTQRSSRFSLACVHLWGLGPPRSCRGLEHFRSRWPGPPPPDDSRCASPLSRFAGFTGGFRWLIRAWWRIGGSGMHRIDRGARIRHDSRRVPSVFAAGVAPVTTAALCRLVLPDRRPARTRAGAPGVPRSPAPSRTGSPACGLAALNPWAGPELDRIRAGQSQT